MLFALFEKRGAMRAIFYMIGFVITLSFLGCGGSDVTTKSNLNNITTKSLDTTAEYKNLKELNSLRKEAGLIGFATDNLLEKAALNHAEYLVKNNLYTHYQADKTPSQRLQNLGYTHDDTAENIYAGNISANRSLEILFSNIYHRLAFLDFGFDEIGLGYASSKYYDYIKVYTYEMGREDDRSNNQAKNPKIVLWPYKNQKNVLPVFYEESPDPLPECSVSGYPVSLQFNQSKSGDIDLESFEIYDENENTIESKILSHSNLLNDKEFVLMPLSRLKWGHRYSVRSSYKEDGILRDLDWSFTTKTLPNPNYTVTKNDQKFTVSSAKTYYFYLPPKDCNDRFETYKYKYSSGVKLDIEMVDNNTLKITPYGSGKVDFTLDNDKSFSIEIR